MTRERIEDMREVVLPFVKKRLLETNYENLGESDAEMFAKDFDEILNLAIKALEQGPVLDKIRAEIEQLRNFRAENYDLEQYCDCFDARIIFRDDVFEILDKYKAESEET